MNFLPMCITGAIPLIVLITLAWSLGVARLFTLAIVFAFIVAAVTYGANWAIGVYL